MALARAVNAWWGAQLVTPWTVGRMPLDDLEEILYVQRRRAAFAEIEREAAERNKQTK